jgi:hypothetical protein
LYEASNTEEPCAGKLHAGNCERPARQLAALSRWVIVYKMEKELPKNKLPIIIRIIAWIWIIGLLLESTGIPASLGIFEPWRIVYTIILNCFGIFAGILLLKGYRQGLIIYLIVTLLNSTIFYLFPPNSRNIESYYAKTAIITLILSPVIFTLLISIYWKKLTWKKP